MWKELEEVARKVAGKRVLLQVPEGLKTEVERMVEVLERHGAEVFVDVDPTYGACDVRMNEARSVGADVIVHVGHAPMLDLSNVYYVEWRKEANIPKILEVISSLAEQKKVCFATTVNFRWTVDEVRKIPNVVVGKGSWRIRYPGVVLGCDTTSCNVEADVNVFLGDGHFHPMAIWVNTRRPTYVVTPQGDMVEVNYERVLRRRLALIGALEGKRVGIIVSSKVGQNRRDLALYLARLARERGYTPHLYVSDYIDPLYLLGLPDDFYVYTGCPRVPIDDAERYEKPLLTPEEFLYKLGLLKDLYIGWTTAAQLRGTGESDR